MPTTYFSPGVYVEEVASGSAPIAGVGTSTAGFIGVIPKVYSLGKIAEENLGNADGAKKDFDLSTYPDSIKNLIYIVKINGNNLKPDEAKIQYDQKNKKYQLSLTQLPQKGAKIAVDYEYASVPAEEVKLCTNFGEFKKFFGDFLEESGQNTLAHAVYGFFRNGGTRCFVVWVTAEEKIKNALAQLELIDEIAIVAAPGIINQSSLNSINSHCSEMGDRFAIFDTPKNIDISELLLGHKEDDPDNKNYATPSPSNYAALYGPWIQVFDPATKTEKFVPPSGHIAGLYARVDSQRGVHKAPANEVLVGAVGLKQNISKKQQAGLNPKGINCIRNLNGNIKVWGARTVGGDTNGEFKYINVRRVFNYMRKSIDEGTQWTVFEPNSPELWARIRRNVTAFLMIVWRSGALFGNTPEQAFYVKCDEETNPPELREQGQVVTEIGVAIVKPAEFVIFHLSQWAGPGK
jgi:hypothetical protein